MIKGNLKCAYKHEDGIVKGSNYDGKNLKFILLTLLKLERRSFVRF